MINRRDWQIAFLKQARSDWEAYQRTHEQMWPACHRLHFLQMATEKLGKALLVGGETAWEEITHTHSALVKFIKCSNILRIALLSLKNFSLDREFAAKIVIYRKSKKSRMSITQIFHEHSSRKHLSASHANARSGSGCHCCLNP